MNNSNINQVDLNLLVVFDAVCELKNTVRAAERLNTSQSAVSHSLGRLRDVLQDPLFVRAARGVVPTPRALALQRPVRDILENAKKIFFAEETFDPRTAVKIFRIATTDYFEQVVFPSLLKTLEKEAPFISIVSRSTQGLLPKEELEKGDFDLAIAGFYQNIPERYFQQRLFEDDFVCVGHKRLFKNRKEKTSLVDYASFRHLLISPQGDLQSNAQKLMAKKGHNIRYSAGLMSFVSPGRILSLTSHILTCPRKLALTYCEFYPLALVEIPIKLPSIHVVQVWHERFHHDLSHLWLRAMIVKACSEL